MNVVDLRTFRRGGEKRKKILTRVGFEPTPGYPDEKPAEAGKLSLESHALDRSAILPTSDIGSEQYCMSFI